MVFYHFIVADFFKKEAAANSARIPPPPTPVWENLLGFCINEFSDFF